ncbi:MAG: GGDEF domain-containing protein [Pseudomonadota bacterium]
MSWSIRGVNNRVRVGYCTAILVIVGLSIASLIFVERIHHSQSQANVLTELVSQQQTQSQRLVLLTNLVHFETNTFKQAIAANTLREAIVQFRDGHKALKEKLELVGIGSNSPIYRAMYDAPYDADFFSIVVADRAAAYLAGLSTKPDVAPHELPLSQMQSIAAYSSLNALKTEINKHAVDTLHSAQQAHRAIFAILMVLLAAEVAVIFAPLVSAVTRRTDELKSARDHMAHLANHDQLTGLNNRTAMAHWYPKIIKQHEADNANFALLHIDLDNFKAINDTYGHAAGDAVLRATGERLKKLVRKHDFTARIGGDEFVLVLANTSSEPSVEKIVGRILDKVGCDIVHDGIQLRVSASIGVAYFPEYGATGDDILINADLALYAAKRTLGNKFVLYRPEMREEFSQQRSLERDVTKVAASA